MFKETMEKTLQVPLTPFPSSSQAARVSHSGLPNGHAHRIFILSETRDRCVIAGTGHLYDRLCY